MSEWVEQEYTTRRKREGKKKRKEKRTEVEEDVSSDGKVVPGIGEFGDRYFGTDGD